MHTINICVYMYGFVGVCLMYIYIYIRIYEYLYIHTHIFNIDACLSLADVNKTSLMCTRVHTGGGMYLYMSIYLCVCL